MQGSAYLDTSALAKWYFEENNSEPLKNYIGQLDTAIISPLVKTEMRCVCARRRRRHEITPEMEMQIYSIFENDLEQGHLLLYPMDDSIYEHAIRLLNAFNTYALRTLDAIHLATLQSHHIQQLATADEVLASVAQELGLEVRFF